MRLVFLGPPGAGKGTQAARLAEDRGVPHVSTGDVLRAAAASRTELGERVRGYMEAGELVPDAVMNDVVAERLNRPECADGFLLDGFPRTRPQAEALDDILGKAGQQLDAVLYVEVPDEELIRRLSGRRTCPRCGAIYHVDALPEGQDAKCGSCGVELVQRADDSPQTVANRLKVYQETTAPLVAYYGDRGLLQRVDGVGTPEEVCRRVTDVVDGLAR